MKYSTCITRMLAAAMLLIIMGGCKKDDASIPQVSTATITAITATTATSGGTVTDDGGATVTEFGVCFSTGQNPTLADNKTSDGGGTGNFISIMHGLAHSTTYYVKAYATNSAGTGYGSALSFTTLP